MPVKGFVAVLAVVASARASRSSSAALRVRGGNVPSRIPATPVSSTQPWQSSPTQHPPAQQPWQSAGAHAQQSTTAERQITDLSQRDSRVGFVRKAGLPRSPFPRAALARRARPPPALARSQVYAVLAVQLLVTAASALTFAGRPELVRAFATTPLGHFALGFAGVGSLLTFLGLVFFRPDGWNAGGLLTLFTGCEALLVGVFCSQFRASSVALVLLQTCAAVTGLTACVLPPRPRRARARARRPRAVRERRDLRADLAAPHAPATPSRRTRTVT